jgi:hypothetical protein
MASYFPEYSLTDTPSSIFPNPFADYTSTRLPRNERELFDICDLVFHANSPVREAARRVLSYFITKFVFTRETGDPLSEDESRSYSNFAERELGLSAETQAWGLDFIAYGNLYLSVFEGFRRFVNCPKCETEGRYTSVPISKFMEDRQKFRYRWRAPKVYGICPAQNCGYHGAWMVNDVRTKDASKLFVKRWSPRQISAVCAENSSRKDYYWTMPASYRSDVRSGRAILLEEEPWEFIEAACAGHDIKFNPGMLFHQAEPTLSGVQSRGLGIPRTIVNFRHVWLWQMLYRQIESIVTDYVLPLRVLTPAPVTNSGIQDMADPLLGVDGGSLRSSFQLALMRKNVDPGQWNFLPAPVQAQLIGGDAKAMIPADILEHATAMLLNGFGFPVEMFKGTLAAQSALPAIRLFVATWQPLVQVLNRASSWVIGRICDLMQWERVTTTLAQPTWIDDIQKQMAILQLAQTGDASKQTGLEVVGLDARQELAKQTDFELAKARQQEVLKRRLEVESNASVLTAPPPAPTETSGQPAGPTPGGAPASAGSPTDPNAVGAGAGVGGGTSALAMVLSPNGSLPTSIDELDQLSQAVVAEIMSPQVATTPGQRQMILLKLGKRSQALHALVKRRLESADNQLRTVGRNMMLQQGAGPQAAQSA